MEGDNGLVKGFHLLLQFPAKTVLLLPVPPRNRIDISGGGIVEIDRKTLFPGFLFDPGQYFRLFLGAVGPGGLFVLLPQTGELVTVIHRRGNGCGTGQDGQ